MPRGAMGAGLLIILTLGIAANFARANDSDTPPSGDQSSSKITVNSVFGRFGYRLEEKSSGKLCQAKLQLDEKAFLESIPSLKQLQMLNPDITQTQINAEPTVLSMAFSVEMAPVSIKEVYDENLSADRCFFKQTLNTVDDYRNDEKEWLFSFWFTRELYMKVNWGKFQPANLAEIAANFKFNPAMMIKANNERGLSKNWPNANCPSGSRA